MTHILEVAWNEGINLPAFIGPFESAEEATEWATLNTPNGVGIVHELAYPYYRDEEGNHTLISRVTETMPLDDLLANWRDGEEHGWQTEFDDVKTRFTAEFDEIANSIQEHGQKEPVLLGNDGRVWDGHKRLTVLHTLGIDTVLVTRA